MLFSDSLSKYPTFRVTTMDKWRGLLSDRANYSLERVESFRKRIATINSDVDISNLCVYVTGSYGRREASEYSDLDLFFIHLGSERSHAISNIDKALIDSCLIRSSRELGFPEFSRGGEYLNIHYLDDILENLGSRLDDYRNYFTARLLLLLEGSPILNDAIYSQAIDGIIDSYYRDFPDHERDFLPIFLVNDILRFWRTLCLNYEHNRNRNKSRVEPREISKNHLKNLKLKFSRLLICYSMVVAILSRTGAVTPDQVKDLVRQTPAERLKLVAEERPSATTAIEGILADYAWFMEITARSESDVLEWISNRDNRNQAFGRAREFGLKMNFLILDSASDSRLRYLII